MPFVRTEWGGDPGNTEQDRGGAKRLKKCCVARQRGGRFEEGRKKTFDREENVLVDGQ